jgi:hypothetical protein
VPQHSNPIPFDPHIYDSSRPELLSLLVVQEAHRHHGQEPEQYDEPQKTGERNRHVTVLEPEIAPDKLGNRLVARPVRQQDALVRHIAQLGGDEAVQRPTDGILQDTQRL